MGKYRVEILFDAHDDTEAEETAALIARAAMANEASAEMGDVDGMKAQYVFDHVVLPKAAL